MSDEIPATCSVVTHFEDAYLKTKDLQRTLRKIPKEEIDARLKNPEFQRVIYHLAKSVFVKNTNVLLSHGFDFDDMSSIVTIYAVEFLPTVAKEVTGKDFYYLMMRYINQRLMNFKNRFDVKFRASEKESDVYLRDYIAAETHLRIQDVVSEPFPYEPSFREEKKFLADQIDDLMPKKTKKISVTKKKEIDDLKQKKREVTKQIAYSQEIFNQLKNDLVANLPKYSKDLAYFASSPHTSADVRKKARAFCKKYDINYEDTLTP